MSLLGGGSNIRLGHWWAPTNSSHSHSFPSYPEANASNLGRVAAALAAFNGTATPLIPPADLSDGTLVAATGAALARYLPPQQFRGLELANEPDISIFKGNYTGYVETLAMWLDALEAAGVSRAVDAPVLAGTSWWPNMGTFLRAFAPRLHAFAQHRYGLSACSHVAPTPDALMAVIPTWATANDTALLASVRAAGLPFAVGEGNTVSCNGSAGVSDVFAAALYALDASFSALAANISAFKWQGIGYDSGYYFYQPIYYDVARLREPGYDAAAPRPLFLGLWALAEAAPAGSVLLRSTVNATGSPLLRAWALRRPGAERPNAVVILYKVDAGSAAASACVTPQAAPCAPGSVATLTRLLPGDEGLSSRTGSSWANLTFDGTEDGIPVGTRADESVPCSPDGNFEFQVTAASAAVLFFGD